MTYDATWYDRKVADVETGEPRRFVGGALYSVDFVLDALWHGVEHENQRRRHEAGVRAVCRLLQLLGGQDVEVAPDANLLSTTAWVEAFDILWEPDNIPPHLDPSTAVNFRLDVLRGMAKLPKSYKRALLHAMDGYSTAEVADLMGWTRVTEVEQIDEAEVLRRISLFGDLRLEVKTEPNVESAERVVRNASSQIRAQCGYDMPGKQKREPRPGALDTSVINDVEREIEEIRAWRRRELRRREIGRGPKKEAA